MILRSVRSDLCFAAMSSDGGSSFECPVMASWAKSSVILKRLADKQLIIKTPGGKLSRNVVVANRDLIVPLMNLVGI